MCYTLNKTIIKKLIKWIFNFLIFNVTNEDDGKC